MTSTEVIEQTGVSRQSFDRAIAALRDADLVVSERDPENGRRKLYNTVREEAVNTPRVSTASDREKSGVGGVSAGDRGSDPGGDSK